MPKEEQKNSLTEAFSRVQAAFSKLEAIDPSDRILTIKKAYLLASLCEVESAIEAQLTEIGGAQGLKQFFGKKTMRGGKTYASAIYGSYRAFTESQVLPTVSNVRFAAFLASKGIEKKRNASGVIYAISLMPAFPNDIHLSNASILFESVLPDLNENRLRADECKPWLIQAVTSYLASSTEIINPANINYLRDLVSVEEIAQNIKLHQLIEQHNRECSSPLALHIAIGLSSLWISSDTMPTNSSQYIQCHFMLLRTRRTLIEKEPLPGLSTIGQ